MSASDFLDKSELERTLTVVATTMEQMEELKDMLENEHFRDVVMKCWAIYNRKGIDYTRGLGDRNRLDNFDCVAENMGITWAQGWGVYFYKHVSAVWKYVKEGRVESEPIEERCYDIINYTILLLLYIKRNKEAAQP